MESIHNYTPRGKDFSSRACAEFGGLLLVPLTLVSDIIPE
jgi:hypothetical protein